MIERSGDYSPNDACEWHEIEQEWNDFNFGHADPNSYDFLGNEHVQRLVDLIFPIGAPVLAVFIIAGYAFLYWARGVH